MNYFKKSIPFFFLIVIRFPSYGQQMVQTPMDAFLVCQRDDEFIGKPLTTLLKEIKPPIKMVYAREGSTEQAPMFSFFFTSRQGFDKQRRKGKLPLRITVYLKEAFKWKEWVKDHYWDWLKEDEGKYGNLTIAAIRVAGVYEHCDNELNANR
jgi:hypothetical protein